VCLLPPSYTGSVQDDVIESLSNGTLSSVHNNRWRTAYTGGVLVLISVLFAFFLAYTNFVSAPKNAAARIGTPRGLCYVIAVCATIVGACISWSYSPVCPTVQNYPAGNGVLILTSFIILSALLYGDEESDSLSLFLVCYGVITYGPTFSTGAQIKWAKWQAQEAVVLSGLYMFMLGVFLDRLKNQGDRRPVAEKLGRSVILDVIALSIGIAGAVCLYTRDQKQDEPNYHASYAIIIPALSLLGNVFDIAAPKVAATFLAYFILPTYDIGSTQETTGYTRGGLMLCQAAALLTILSKAVGRREGAKSDRDFFTIIAPPYVAVAKFICACLVVPSNYSVFLLMAITVFAGTGFDDADFGRISFLILAWNGFVGNFLFLSASAPVNIIDFASSVVFAIHYLRKGAPAAPALTFGAGGSANEPDADQNMEKKVESVA